MYLLNFYSLFLNSTSIPYTYFLSLFNFTFTEHFKKSKKMKQKYLQQSDKEFNMPHI